MSVQSMPIVTVCDGIVTTLSTDIASFFEKRHDAVIRSIETILETLPIERLHNFVETCVSRANPNNPNVLIKSKAYRLTRDGFTFLAMGFTGAKAQAFKWAYIDAFNKMEAQLSSRNNVSTANNSLSVDTLTPAQQLLIQQAVGRRAQRTASHYQTIYRAIKLRFQIARYDQLPQSQLNECLAFIEGVDLNVPEAKETVYNPRQKTYTVTADFLERQRILVYNLKYLFNKPLMQAMRVMQALDIPDANKLCDAVHDMNLVQVERNLEQLGFAVKDLDCYKHWLANN